MTINIKNTDVPKGTTAVAKNPPGIPRPPGIPAAQAPFWPHHLRAQAPESIMELTFNGVNKGITRS